MTTFMSRQAQYKRAIAYRPRHFSVIHLKSVSMKSFHQFCWPDQTCTGDGLRSEMFSVTLKILYHDHWRPLFRKNRTQYFFLASSWSPTKISGVTILGWGKRRRRSNNEVKFNLKDCNILIQFIYFQKLCLEIWIYQALNILIA